MTAIKHRRVLVVTRGSRKLAAVRFRKYIPKRIFAETKALPGRYWEPGFRQWLVPIPTVAAASDIVAWATARRFTVDQELVAIVNAARQDASDRRAFAREM